MKEIFEWNRLFFNELPQVFLLEVIFRSTVMFTILLLTLKLAGKRGVKQLSIFETVIIIALGSAAGDPMFYEDVGIAPAAIVFLVIIILYRSVTWLTGKSKKFEEFIEGKTECLINDGKFSITSFKKETLAQDEFFSELRVKSIEHLGQVKHAFIEPSGEISVFFYEEKDVKYGLPILPALFNKKSKIISTDGIYACTFCGHTQEVKKGTTNCEICKKDEWVSAIKTLRIT
ncbi:DUF421 domain-containing protein [Flavobacterium sp. WLB]|jgi:uncharacterized membrane protein YcaP (DUF421 family)|uniref:YetF C-terminal domain-containing protein n=1 Tax=Flavobacterium panici TaxID=2654843 RepID=A0A9N8J186_9FLAO|nr:MULTISPECIES: YetF domain-containing protein [Flavobacterium]KOP36495.1 hypothetical protein AKO67_18915 [Flavobacterium sp. VMW]OWU90555.1 hypothetical protein APR43_11265 [Flavobacterium sp. NLM]PUU70363.1 DUF421 domain-containing protein [Flavobacterium sp. WLB]UUF12367.1 DUF421 domain-containing protein [Flavobacterium panici]CAC9974361.1 hypothetical protein FLAPXU55_02058 [Flavobacterium panici]